MKEKKRKILFILQNINRLIMINDIHFLEKQYFFISDKANSSFEFYCAFPSISREINADTEVYFTIMAPASTFTGFRKSLVCNFYFRHIAFYTNICK
jgi:hypothetical protein